MQASVQYSGFVAYTNLATLSFQNSNINATLNGSYSFGLVGQTYLQSVTIQNSCFNLNLGGYTASSSNTALIGYNGNQTVTITNVSLGGAVNAMNSDYGNVAGYSCSSTITVQNMNCSQNLLNTTGSYEIGFIAYATNDSINITCLNISNQIQLANDSGILMGMLYETPFYIQNSTINS